MGMGVMGGLLALALHNAGWQVTLFEQHSGNTNCSLAAAGLLTPLSELDKADALIFQLGQAAIQTLWPRIINQLSAETYFKHSGSIVINHPRDHAEWHHFSQRIASRLHSDKIHFNFQQLTNQALIQLEPELAKFETAYYFPDEAQIDCQSLMPALNKYLKANGINYVINTPVLALKPKQIITKTTSYKFDLVFDCRGLGAQSVFTDLRPLRGELIWLYAPDVHLHRPIRLLHPRYSLYIVPRPNNSYLIGASEIEANDPGPISVQTTLELLTAAYYVHAGFAEARIVKTVTHCRPTLANHLPRIKFTEGLIAINGLYRHGYLIAPALAEEVVQGIKTNYQHLNYPTIWESYL